MGPKGCPETSVRNYHYSLHNSAEERSSPLLNTNCSSFTSLKMRAAIFSEKAVPIYKFMRHHAARNRNLSFKLRRHLLRTIPIAAEGLHSFTTAGYEQNTVERLTMRQLLRQVRQACDINEAIQELLRQPLVKEK